MRPFDGGSSPSTLPTRPVEGAGRVGLIVVACALVLGAAYAVRSLVAPMLLGACVASLARPFMDRLRRFGPRRAAAAATAAVVVVLALPLVPVALAIGAEAKGLVALARAGRLTSVVTSVSEAPHPPRSAHELVHALGPRLGDALPSLVSAAGDLALGVFVFLMTLYYALVDGDAALRFVRRVSPLASPHLDALSRAFVEVGRAVLVSVGLTALVEGGAGGIAFFAIGLPNAALLTVLTALAALVPIGTVLVWGPVAALLWSEGRTFAASVIVFTGLVVISGIDHFVRPQLARAARGRIHPLLVFVGMFGGMASLGAWGMFAGPLLLGLGVAALRLWDREQRARMRAATGPSTPSDEAAASSVIVARVEPDAEEVSQR